MSSSGPVCEFDQMAGEFDRRGELVAADGVAGEDVAVAAQCRSDGQRDDGMVDSGIGRQAAGPGDIAEAAELSGVVEAQRRGAGEPVPHHALGQGERGDFGQVGRDGS